MKKVSKRPDLLIVRYGPETMILEKTVKLKNVLHLSLLKYELSD